MVEAFRAGAIFARDQKQYDRWRRKARRTSERPVGLTGAALESAVRGLAARNPEYVVMGAG